MPSGNGIGRQIADSGTKPHSGTRISIDSGPDERAEPGPDRSGTGTGPGRDRGGPSAEQPVSRAARQRVGSVPPASFLPCRKLQYSVANATTTLASRRVVVNTLIWAGMRLRLVVQTFTGKVSVSPEFR